jgi:hypothetical protein
MVGAEQLHVTPPVLGHCRIHGNAHVEHVYLPVAIELAQGGTLELHQGAVGSTQLLVQPRQLILENAHGFLALAYGAQAATPLLACA